MNEVNYQISGKPWPEPGDPRHETAVEAAANEIWPLDSLSTDAARDELRRDTDSAIAAYLRSLVDQGVVLVDASEVAEWLDDQCGSARAYWFLVRFGGSGKKPDQTQIL